MVNITKTSSGSSLNTSENNQLGVCPICQEDMEGQGKINGKDVTVIATPCKHYFHSKCIDDLVIVEKLHVANRKVTCPCCREDMSKLPLVLIVRLNKAVEDCNFGKFQEEWKYIQDINVTITADDLHQLAQKTIQRMIKSVGEDNLAKFNQVMEILKFICNDDLQLLNQYLSSVGKALNERMSNEFKECNYDNLDQFRRYASLIWPKDSDFESDNIFSRDGSLRLNAKALSKANKTLNENVISLIQAGSYKKACAAMVHASCLGLSLSDDARQTISKTVSKLNITLSNEMRTLIQKGLYTKALLVFDQAKSLGLSLTRDVLIDISFTVSAALCVEIPVNEVDTVMEVLSIIKSAKLVPTDLARNKIKQFMDKNNLNSDTELLGILNK